MRVITISLNTLWQPSEASLLKKLRGALPSIISVDYVERVLFSNRFSIKFSSTVTDEMVKDIFRSAIINMGYEPDIILIEQGNFSTVAGGIEGAADYTAKTVAKPLASVAVIAVAAAVLYVLIMRRK